MHQQPANKVFGIAGLTRAVRGSQGTDWMLPLFWSLGCRYPGLRVGEIGFRGGTSALAWLLATREMNGHLWSMDIYSCDAGRQLVEESGLSKYFTFIHGDSSMEEFPESLDILFIDGDHDYQHVCSDYDKHSQKVKPGGLVLFHDTVSEPGVAKFMAENEHITNITIGLGLGIIQW